MDRQQLKDAAEALATAEMQCRELYFSKERCSFALNKCKDRRERWKFSQQLNALESQYALLKNNVTALSRQVNQLHAKAENHAHRRYWWNIPFAPEGMQEQDAFFLDGGSYVELGELTAAYDKSTLILQHKPSSISVSQLAELFSSDQYLCLFLNKQNYQAHINKKLQRTYLYNVLPVSSCRAIAAHITRSEPLGSDIWKEYVAISQSNEQHHQEELQRRNVYWDNRERILHLSPFTNEERWLMGQLSTDDYVQEDVWRSYDIADKNLKHRDAQEQAFKKYIQTQSTISQQQKRAQTETVCENNLLRILPVGEIIRYGDDLISALLYMQPQHIYEFDCFPEVSIPEFSGRIHSYTHISTKRPALIPLIHHIAFQYADKLPAYSVLKPCPTGFPDVLWRTWAESRWEQVLQSSRTKTS